jgi:cytosine/adenosine deaminase-related metal-dependent hydrolase
MRRGNVAKMALGGWAAVMATAALAAADTWAIKGDIVLPDQDAPKKGWLLFDDASILKVDCSGEDIPFNAQILEYKGYIFPTLIDCHNHADWNSIKLWRADKKYNNRYEWQQDPLYLMNVKQIYYGKIFGKFEYASLKYAEIRAIIGGTTVLQSTYVVPPTPMFMRNLDSRYQADSRIGNILDVTEEGEDAHRFRLGLANGATRRIFLHIAEGKCDDDESLKEFPHLEEIGLVRPGVVIIHGIALDEKQLQKLKQNGMYLVWSPKSNLVLYGETALIGAAIDAGVTIALGPDWSITGSNNVLGELKFAHAYAKKKGLEKTITPRRLFRMVTVDAAEVAGLTERLGVLRHGNAADLMLVKRKAADPYESLLMTEPADIDLVFIDGVPVYGDEKLLKSHLPDDQAKELDRLEIQGSKEPKAIHLRGNPRGPWHWYQRYPALENELKKQVPRFAPLIEEQDWPPLEEPKEKRRAAQHVRGHAPTIACK